jgi:arylsulfatase A-like enzyme
MTFSRSTGSMLASLLLLLPLVLISGWGSREPMAAAKRPPNIVIILADDLGYADIAGFGAPAGETPHLDRMAREGIRLTSFYAAQAVCSASRAALLTGTYPNRIGIRGALDHRARYGLNAAEQTIAEALRTRGYATAAIGKWHLGHHPEFLPARHGFDEYFGLPYSNDMWPRHPTSRNFYPELPLIEGERIIRLDPDQSQLTTQYTERAVGFIERNRDRPFFLYLAQSMPHVPLFVSDKHRGRTGRGLYRDVIAEIDWSVGQILETIKRQGLDRETLVIFTSDNGPWLEYGDHAGSRGHLRGSKGTAFEGGVRVPFIARWPGRIPAATASHTPAMTIDLLPTLAALAGSPVSTERSSSSIDGRDIWPHLSGKKNAREPHDALYFYWGDELHAVRSGRWKLHLPHPWREVLEEGRGGEPGKIRQSRTELALYDLERDPGETTDLAAAHPEIVRKLQVFVERARADLGDALTARTGKNLRPAGALP